jgi:xanthine/uracil/vitamin C permease (AzgA family)
MAPIYIGGRQVIQQSPKLPYVGALPTRYANLSQGVGAGAPEWLITIRRGFDFHPCHFLFKISKMISKYFLTLAGLK